MGQGTVRIALSALALLGPVGAAVPAADAPGPRRFEITASRYDFAPPRIEVRQGEAVELVVRSADTDHGFEIKPYRLKIAVPKGGAAVTASFVASRPGRFPFSCSEYCGSGHRRMRGELVVTETPE